MDRMILPNAPRINPSILSADFVNMQRDLERISGADFVHVDVMDNHFVPNLTFGPQMVARIQATSPVPLDVHLMISDADRWAPGYAELGAASVTFHLEAATDPIALARRIRDIGSRVGVAIKPDSSAEQLYEHLDEFDQILVMTVEPGFGGQSFRDDMMPKLRGLKDEARRHRTRHDRAGGSGRSRYLRRRIRGVRGGRYRRPARGAEDARVAACPRSG
jgi:ribulose-phosphate 3-epimerase